MVETVSKSQRTMSPIPETPAAKNYHRIQPARSSSLIFSNAMESTPDQVFGTSHQLRSPPRRLHKETRNEWMPAIHPPADLPLGFHRLLRLMEVIERVRFQIAPPRRSQVVNIKSTSINRVVMVASVLVEAPHLRVLVKENTRMPETCSHLAGPSSKLNLVVTWKKWKFSCRTRWSNALFHRIA